MTTPNSKYLSAHSLAKLDDDVMSVMWNALEVYLNFNDDHDEAYAIAVRLQMDLEMERDKRDAMRNLSVADQCAMGMD